jgi:hypothetical protein
VDARIGGGGYGQRQGGGSSVGVTDGPRVEDLGQPWAWPRDGRRETLEGAGISLAKQYRDQGLNMLHEHARYDDKSMSVEAGLMDMLTRMETAL